MGRSTGKPFLKASGLALTVPFEVPPLMGSGRGNSEMSEVMQVGQQVYLVEQRSSRAQVEKERISTSVRSDILPALYSQANLMTSCFGQEFVISKISTRIYTYKHISHTSYTKFH